MTENEETVSLQGEQSEPVQNGRILGKSVDFLRVGASDQ